MTIEEIIPLGTIEVGDLIYHPVMKKLLFYVISVDKEKFYGIRDRSYTLFQPSFKRTIEYSGYEIKKTMLDNGFILLKKK